MIMQATSVAADWLAVTPYIHRSGQLDVRLATSPEEIAAAQALRYQIFYDEMGAAPPEHMAAERRDIDDYDSVCDHLLVIDHGFDGRPHVVGTYRLLRQVVAQLNRGFYSAGEYDLSPLIETSRSSGQLLELGRSCVAPAYRNNATITLLWRGIASYLQTHSIGYLFGCASLHGANAGAHAVELSYLYHNHLAPPGLRARSLPEHYVAMDVFAPTAFDARAAAKALPPLVKGYLRVGAMIGDGAFLDRQFDTTDIFVVMPVERITKRYAGRFEIGANVVQ
jgi:putative hemolysin